MSDDAHVVGARNQTRARTVLHLLRGPYVTVGERRADVPEGGKRLVAFVALHRRQVERRRVAGTLWPDGGEARAAGNLRSALWRLRGAGVDVLAADKWCLALCEDVVTDLELVHDWARRMIDGTARQVDLTIPPRWADALELLPGLYDEWVLLERERMRQQVLHGLEALSRRLVAAGRYPEAAEAAMLAVRAEPLRESGQRALIEAHLAEGNRVEALRTFRTYRQMLLKELGVGPSVELQLMVESPSRVLTRACPF